MPEGDTIRRLAERVSARVVGQVCRSTTTRDPRLVGVDFTGQRLIEADARGKHLLLRFDSGTTLYSHLLMHGAWEIGRLPRAPEWKRRVELHFDAGWLTAVDVPKLGTVPTSDEDTVIGHLGPDLCGAEAPDVGAVVERMRRDPTAPLATAMLDQRNVAGWGNIYAVEVPFVVGVSPFHPVGQIDRLDRLVGTGTALIRTNARLGPQNTTGRRLATAAHWVYGLRGRPCPWCSTKLLGAGEHHVPWGRVSTWCPTCQPADGTIIADLARITRALALHPARRDAAFPTD